MNIKCASFFICAVLVQICLVQQAEAQRISQRQSLMDKVEALPWQRGPAEVEIGAHSHMYIPARYMLLAPPASETFLQLNENPTSGDDDYIFARDDFGWFADMSFDPTGFVKDKQTITPSDAAAVLDRLRTNTDAANKIRIAKGWPTLTLQGWYVPPNYNRLTRRLEWATKFTYPDGGQDVNFDTRILGRYGVMQLDLVGNTDDLVKDIGQFNRIIGSFSFDSGYSYADHRGNDKIAKYGILGLIAGGAAAAAVKTGFLAAIAAAVAGFGKAIFAIVVGSIAIFWRSIKSLFSRR